MTPDQREWSRSAEGTKLDETCVLWHNITSVLKLENVTVFYKEPDTVSDRILVGYGIGIRLV